MDAAADTPLANVRVLDLTQFLSGPYCTQMLADLGAEVVKLESPQGDLARYIPPHFIGNDSVYYLSINRTKGSVVVDLKAPKGQQIVRDLIMACDVFVENFRPGVLARLGIEAATLRERKPDLIWCSISGFGQDGPYREKPAYDMIVQALSGGMSITGEPGRTAVRAGIPIGDISAGMYAASAILAALYRRGRSGIGDVIDISMLDCQVAMLSYQAAYHLHSGQVPGRQGSGHDSIPTYRSFRAGDGNELVITANTERMWQGLCRVLACETLVDDPRFATNRLRYENRTELWPLLEAAFARKSADAWVPLLEQESIPVGVVNTLDRVMADPQVTHRGMVVQLAAEDGRTARVMGNPIRFAESRTVPPRFPPKLGEHTRQALGQILGLSNEEITKLADDGIIVAADLPREVAQREVT